MTTASNRKVRPLRLAVLAMAPGSFWVGAPAHAETQMGVDVSAGGSVESNPYLTRGGGADISATLDVTPWLKLSDDVSSFDLSGGVSVRQYAKSANGTDVSGTINIAGTHRLSSYMSISGGVNYLTSRNGINQGFAIAGPNDPLPPPTASLPDISLGGTRTRTQSMSANVGLSARVTAYDSLSANASVSKSIYDSAAGRDYKFVNGSVNYSRTLSERISATASVRYGKSYYYGTRVGDGTILTPELGVDMTIDSHMTLSASLGASFTRSDNGIGPKSKSTQLSGQGRLCYRAEGSGICAVAARSAQPTALGGISTVTAISAIYDTRLSARDNVNFSLSYNGGNNDQVAFTGPKTSKYYSAGGTWSHNFGRRLSVYVSPSYSRIMNLSQSYNSYRLTAGLRLSFGATQ